MRINLYLGLYLSFLMLKDYVRSVVIADFFGIRDIMMYNSTWYGVDNVID